MCDDAHAKFLSDFVLKNSCLKAALYCKEKTIK